MSDIKGAYVRTPAEILARMESSDDFFGTQKGDLLAWLPFDIAQTHLMPGVTEPQWDEARATGDPLDKARDYLPFAWRKANDCRALSAGRSVEHLKAWLWLAGFDVSGEFDRMYKFYGKPCLVAASIISGFPWEISDSGRWSNDEGDGGISNNRRDALIEEAVAYASRLSTPAPQGE